jgi:sulfur-carrier protein
MSIEVEIAHVFRSYLGGQKSVTTDGKTVGECLDDLSIKYPMTKNMIVDSNGNVTNRFEIYLNGESTYETGLSTSVKDGDKIDLVYIIHGG